MKPEADSFQIHTNGRLRSIVLPNGNGGLYHDWVAITRWSEAVPGVSGPAVYLRDGAIWNQIGAGYDQDGIQAGIQIRIARNEDIEIRRITLSNTTEETRTIELTTYAEISLNHPMGDAGHPAFSKLFVQTESVDGMLLARRRPRGANENWPWVAQALRGDYIDCSWETNRATFIGRGRNAADPQAMDLADDLGLEAGNVLDPVMAWRCRVPLAPGETKTLWLLTAVGPDKAQVTDILVNADAEDLFLSAPADANARYDALAATMLLGRKDRVVPESIAGSGVVHRFPLSPEEIRVIATAGMDSPAARELLDALPYWRSRGLQVKLFIIVDELPVNGVAADAVVVKKSDFTADEWEWWLASAQLVIGDEIADAQAPVVAPAPCVTVQRKDVPAYLEEELSFFNGQGGFRKDGREYVILLPLKNGRLQRPPMPWCNVLANQRLGCTVTDNGAGYTWARNSQANRLTQWSNDPMRDPNNEAFYLRDEVTGEVWSPLPGPGVARTSFIVRHGFGYSLFLSKMGDLAQEVEFLVPPEDAVKLVAVRLRNKGAGTRRLSFAALHQLILASSPDRHHATLAWTDGEGVQHARNPRAGDFAGGQVFAFSYVTGADVLAEVHSNSLQAFLGQGTMESPEMKGEGARGYGRDACFGSRTSFELAAGEEVELVVAFGEALSESETDGWIEKYRQPGAMAKARAETDAHWQEVLGHVQIQTPLPEVDVLMNGWLVYQNLACRIWGRSAFYQSGGAYGFRDQLQDAAAFAVVNPEILRQQILLHAAQQFPEGDVTHWWHPAPMGTGMRTKFSDDLLWLPWLTEHYLRTTGDYGILDEERPFIQGPELTAHEDEEYMKPSISAEHVSVFEHCCRSMDRSLTKGIHGLPLMGIGDWNDGMSRIGREGKGESVWMGFFLYEILKSWIPLCEARGESKRAERYAIYRNELLEAINTAGWDGEWYRRAYYDDGTPLGTHTDEECRIDALAQAWAVISKAAPAARAEQALDALERELIDESVGIVRLLHPPFVNTPHDPGYIKGYVAGVRENGGQYTHAACWVVRAMAEAGRRDQAARILKHLTPVWQARDETSVARYQVEPYAIAADIYGAAPHVGRGGWTWYTGSAGWMFRVTLESLLGLRVENGDMLVLDPRMPNDWPGFTIHYRTPSGRTLYQIEVKNPHFRAERIIHLEVNGVPTGVETGIGYWPLLDDGRVYQVTAVMG